MVIRFVCEKNSVNLFKFSRKNSYLPRMEKVYELPQVSLCLTKAGLLVITEIISSWQQTTPKPSNIVANSLLEDVFPSVGKDLENLYTYTRYYTVLRESYYFLYYEFIYLIVAMILDIGP